LVKLNDLRVFKGASFDNKSLEFNFVVSLEERLENGVLINVDIFDQNNKFKQYAAKVLLSTEKPNLSIPTPPEKLDYKEFDESIQDAYENYLFHGESLQCIKSISGYSEVGIGAILETSKPSDLIKNSQQSSWISDPLVLDGMAQMGLVWLGKTQGCIGIPQGFDSYCQIKPFEGNLVKCMIHVSKLDTKAFKAELDTWFFDQDSQLIAYGSGWKAIFNESFNSYTTKAKKANK
ncbi:polyketide synthase dehydratase domain-containing protein, partial [bacterium]|nr:polyketide synthase dehydratase domain-containing protein [bacterium]